MVPVIYRKYLTSKTRNQSISNNKTSSAQYANQTDTISQQASIDEMLRNMARYNELQSVLNEDLFGPLQNDSVIIVVQVK